MAGAACFRCVAPTFAQVGETPADLDQEQEANILQKVFGSRKSAKDVLMEFDVVLDGEDVGQAMVLIGSKKKVFVKSLKEVLKDYLNAEELDKVDAVQDNKGFVSFDQLQFLQLDTKFDSVNLKLIIDVPVEKKKTRSLGYRRRRGERKPNVKNAALSGILNVRYSQEILNGNSSSGKQSVVILTPSVNYNGVCLESEFSHRRVDGKFDSRREYTRLVYDMPDRCMMVRCGDIFSYSLNYLQAPRLLGLEIDRDPARNGYTEVASPIQVMVLRKSTVEVYIDGALVKTDHDIAPGPYRLDDLPYRSGTNDVRIKIIDDTGRSTIIDSTSFLDSSFLGRGMYAYKLIAGCPDKISSKESRYDTSNPFVSGSFRYGLFDGTECMIGASTNKIGHVFAANIRNRNRLGTINAKYAQNNHKDSVNGNVFFLSYSSERIKLPKDVGLHFSVQFEDTDMFFIPYLGSEVEAQNASKRTTGRRKNVNLHVYLSNILGMSFGVSHSWNRSGVGDKYNTLTFSTSKSLPIRNNTFSSAYMNCFFSRRNSNRVKNSRTLGLTCTLYFNKNNAYLSAHTYDSATYLTYSNWNREHGFGYTLSSGYNRGTRSVNASASYEHSRYKANIRYSHNSKSSDTAQFAVESSLVFADGTFAVTKPISDGSGFVIIKPTKALAKHNVRLNGSRSESGLLGGAVMPTSRGYVSTSSIDMRSIPDTIDVKNDSFTARGEYKRGAVAEVSADGDYIANGRLCFKGGKPIDSVGGYVVHKTDKSADPIPFFTNGDGKFTMTNLQEGVYTVSVNMEGCEDFDIEIKPPDNKILNLGNITCAEEE